MPYMPDGREDGIAQALRIALDHVVRAGDRQAIRIGVVLPGGNDKRQYRHDDDEQRENGIGRWEGEFAFLLLGHFC
jgi:hypothetical protein